MDFENLNTEHGLFYSSDLSRFDEHPSGFDCAKELEGFFKNVNLNVELGELLNLNL